MDSSSDFQTSLGEWVEDTLGDPDSLFTSVALSMVLGTWSVQQFIFGDPVF